MILFSVVERPGPVPPLLVWTWTFLGSGQLLMEPPPPPPHSCSIHRPVVLHMNGTMKILIKTLNSPRRRLTEAVRSRDATDKHAASVEDCCCLFWCEF